MGRRVLLILCICPLTSCCGEQYSRKIRSSIPLHPQDTELGRIRMFSMHCLKYVCKLKTCRRRRPSPAPNRGTDLIGATGDKVST